VLLGFALAGAAEISITASLISLAAFLAGAGSGGFLARRLEAIATIRVRIRRPPWLTEPLAQVRADGARIHIARKYLQVLAHARAGAQLIDQLV